jgi:hypothetical protein
MRGKNKMTLQEMMKQQQAQGQMNQAGGMQAMQQQAMANQAGSRQGGMSPWGQMPMVDQDDPNAVMEMDMRKMQGFGQPTPAKPTGMYGPSR